MVKIYVLIDPRNNEIRYVGQTHRDLKTRFREHIIKKDTLNTHCKKWINQLLKLDLYPIMELLEEVPKEDWAIQERYWISQFKCWGFNLTNLSIGGEGCFGVKRSEETKEKMRNVAKNRSKESIKKTIATRRKRGKYVWSEESRQKASKSHMGLILPSKRIEIIQYSLNGEFIKEWKGAVDAAENLKISQDGIYNCLAKMSKTSGGFKWKYKKQ